MGFLEPIRKMLVEPLKNPQVVNQRELKPWEAVNVNHSSHHVKLDLNKKSVSGKKTGQTLNFDAKGFRKNMF